MSACSIHDLALKFPDQRHRQRKTHLLQGSEHAWRVFLDLRAGMTVLDLGCGFGARSESLLAHRVNLIAIDTNDRATRFTKSRLATSASNSVACPLVIRVNSLTRLPVASHLVDLLLLPVDLDPDSVEDSESQRETLKRVPSTISLRRERSGLLREAARVLKPDGQVVLVGANRWDLERVQTELRRALGWAPLEPSSNAGGALSTPRPYRAPRSPALGLSAYCRALRGVGVDRVSVFTLRREKSGMLAAMVHRDLEPPSAHAWKFKGWVKGQKHLAPEFLFISSRKRPGTGRSIDRILETVAQELRHTGVVGRSLTVDRIHVSRKDKLIAELFAGSSRLILRLPLSPGALWAERNAVATLRHLMNTRAPDTWFPWLLCSGQSDGFEFTVEEKATGRPLGRVANTETDEEALSEAEKVLSLMNPSLSKDVCVTLEGPLYERLVAKPLECVARALECKEHRDRLEQFFRRSLLGLQTRTGIQHGDFGKSNILCAEDGRRVVIDWEDSITNGLPILDAISVVASLRPPRGFDDPLASHRHHLAFGSLAPEHEAFLAREFERTATPPTAHAALVYLNWVHFASGLLKFSFMQQPEFLRFYVRDVASFFCGADNG